MQDAINNTILSRLVLVDYIKELIATDVPTTNIKPIDIELKNALIKQLKTMLPYGYNYDNFVKLFNTASVIFTNFMLREHVQFSGDPVQIFSRKDLLKKPVVDCGKCYKNDPTTPGIYTPEWHAFDERIESEGGADFFDYLPPFEDCVYITRVENESLNLYTHCKFVNVDAENSTFRAFITCYCYTRTLSGERMWNVMYKACTDAKMFSEGLEIEIGLWPVEKILANIIEPFLESVADKKEFYRWSKAVSSDPQLKSHFTTLKEMAESSIKMFLSTVTVANYMIEENRKPKTIPSGTITAKQKDDNEKGSKEKLPKKPVTRIFAGDLLKVTSIKRPRVITKETLKREYKTLAWQRAAHTRTLQSGKTIWIKSSICGRKGHEEEKEKFKARRIIISDGENPNKSTSSHEL